MSKELMDRSMMTVTMKTVRELIDFLNDCDEDVLVSIEIDTEADPDEQGL